VTSRAGSARPSGVDRDDVGVLQAGRQAGLARARGLVTRARRDGVASALAHAARRAPQLAAERVVDLRLEREQARGVLGPAHRAWRGKAPQDNVETWTRWDWSSRGEEWNVSEEWKRGLIVEVLRPSMPAGGALLEIGPGGGRWTEELAARAGRLVLVEVTPRALDLCRARLGERLDVEYVLSGGCDFPGVADRSIDGVWSFDVLVHVAPLDQAGYLTEIARVLRPGGVAALHHADGRNRGLPPSRHGWRAPMSAGLFARLAADRGLAVERQLRSWCGGRFDLAGYHDVITVLRAPADPRSSA
jgi:SAM-dependent methyltransferase